MTRTALSLRLLTAGAAARLFCLPYAGGGTAVYYRWRSSMPPRVDLVPLCYPGHDGRMQETLFTSVRSLAAALVDDIRPVLDRPFALLGHSLGAWVAFEMARELRRRGEQQPTKLIVSAARPPDTTLPADPLYKLPNEEFIAALDQRYAGMPSVILNSSELLELLLPVLRADIEMVETYEYLPEPPLDINILALRGRDDPAISPSDLEAWRRQTARNFDAKMFDGGHFFPFWTANTAPALDVLQLIADEMKQVANTK